MGIYLKALFRTDQSQACPTSECRLQGPCPSAAMPVMSPKEMKNTELEEKKALTKEMSI